MNIDSSFLSYFMNAGLIVKLVLIFLVAASILSWTLIIQRSFYLRDTRDACTEFENRFWSGGDLTKLYAELKDKKDMQGVAAIFQFGFREFLRLHKQPGMNGDSIMESAKRAMRVAEMREQDKMEMHLPILATLGSISPYLGLFGTVWGIMLSLRGLANVQQATVAMVAPGLAEALIATAMGLFVAIPAVVAYNRYSSHINRLMNRFEAFQDEFTNILFRQTQSVVTRPDTQTVEG
ncbi:MAG: protein TolQ [Pseudomonadota bacterium]